MVKLIEFKRVSTLTFTKVPVVVLSAFRKLISLAQKSLDVYTAVMSQKSVSVTQPDYFTQTDLLGLHPPAIHPFPKIRHDETSLHFDREPPIPTQHRLFPAIRQRPEASQKNGNLTFSSGSAL